MKTFPRFIFSSLMVVILFGCGADTQADAPTVISSPSSTEITISQTATHLPTATLKVSSTPMPSRIPNLTQTAIAQYPRMCKDRNSYVPPKYSPDALWQEEFCFSDEDETPILTLSNKVTQVIWKLFYRDFIVNMNDGNGLGVVHWSPDKINAYFASFPTLDGRICFMGANSQYFGKGLFRIDLQTGTVTTILPLREDFGNYIFSFSPTGRRLIYETYSSDLIILDIKTGESVGVKIADKYQLSGGHLWSSNGIELIYSTVLYNENFEPIAYSLRLVDTQTGIERLVLDTPENCLIARSWSDDNILTIESKDENSDSVFIEYDLNTSNIRESTATP